MISICFILTLLISIFIQTHGKVACASGWVNYEGNCYLFSSVRTWDQCNAYCPTSYPGATMLCVNKQTESAWIKSQSNNEVWIGYTDMPPYGLGKGTKQYRWITGCSSPYNKGWNDGEPNNGGNNEDCTLINSNSKWDDRPCQSAYQCACQYTLLCASGWVNYEGNCYLFNSVRTWDQCNAYCPTSYPGATMLCVNKQTETAWIKSQSNNEVWIGYTDMPPYGLGKGTKQYRWVTGCSSPYINGWNDGEPNNGGNNEDCTLINSNSKWDDRPCQSTYQCACQYDPVLTTAPTYRPSTVAPTTSSPSTVAPTTSSPSTVAPTTSSPSTVAPTTAVPSTLIPTAVGLPECPDGWNLHCNCEWTSGPEKNNNEHVAALVDTKVSSNDVGYNNGFFRGALVGSIGSLSLMITVLYLFTCLGKRINIRSEYYPINDRESG